MSKNEFRRIIDLNGEWEIRIGDSDTWQRILVPSSLDYNKTLRLKKNFFLPKNAADFNVKLIALGINYNCSIKLNGVYIGSHTRGYTGFSMDFLEATLRPGEENSIEIEIDNGPESDVYRFLRPQPWGWKRYSGIIREIFLLLQPKITITNWKIDFSFDESYENTSAVLTFRFQNFSQASRSNEQSESSVLQQENIQEIGYYVEIYNMDTGKLVKDNTANPKLITVHQAVQDTLHFNFRNVELWSPEYPVRYKLQVTLIKRNNAVVDRFQSTFGFRDIDFRNDGFYLNGKKTKLIGIYRIEQHPDYGVSLPWEIQKRDLELIKDLGINIVRSGPYPNHPYFYELCDQLGLMVLEEIPVHQIPGSFIGKEETIEYAGSQLQEMIERDRHHPSIIGWGLGSNFDVSDSKTASYMTRLVSLARKLDTRPLYYSTEMPRNDICSNLVDFKLLDFYSPDIAKVQRTLDEFSIDYPGLPVYIGRIGAMVIPENDKGGFLDPTSLEYQAQYVSELFNLTENNAQINGIFFWSFADWRGTVPVAALEPNSKDLVYSRGLLTEDRIPRPAYRYLNARIFENKLTALSSGSIPDDTQRNLVVAGFAIIIVVLVAVKQHRWFGQNYRRSLLFPKIFFEDVLGRRNLQIWQTMMLGFAIGASIALGIASFSFLYKDNIYFDLIISQLFISPGLKSIIVYLIWHPIINAGVITIFFVAMILVLAFLHNAVLILFGSNRGITFSLHLLIWSGSNLLFVLPFSMALYSVIKHQTALIFYLIIVVIFFIWFISRLILALRVAFSTFFKKSLIILVIIVITFWGGISFLMEKNYQSFTYINMYRKIVNSQYK